MKRCPECGDDAVEVNEWSDGAVSERCWSCGYWDWEPPTPVVR